MAQITSIKVVQSVPSRQGFAFLRTHVSPILCIEPRTHLERDLSRNINIKEMNFAMHRNQVPYGRRGRKKSPYEETKPYLEDCRQCMCCTTCRPEGPSPESSLVQFSEKIHTQTGYGFYLR